MKKKNYLTLGLGMILLSGLAAFSYAQTNTGGDEKKTSKIEKRVEVEDKNGEKKVTITTIENGVSKTEILSGKEAEEFLLKEKSVKTDGKEIIRIKTNSNPTPTSNESQTKTIIIDSESGTLEDMDAMMLELEEKLKKMGMQFDIAGQSTENLNWVIRINDEEKEVNMTKCEDFEFINEEEVKLEDGSIKKVVVRMDVKCKMKEEEKKEKEGVVKSESLTVYPNPATNSITIEFETPTNEQAEMKVLDLTGKVIYSETISGNTQHKKTFNTSSLPAGVYIVNIIQGEFEMKKKVVVGH